ncbi:methyl-accepting chemotaxis protein [Fluviispira vulneris]|uniref:methyl-accepting chemotaxis protein n=1 Tax=Fluviispira vulneris TaxID=2763012 RepID=UPI001646AD32|nr:methyl-accepting chemotaxis protein [Fluviispira vulneris]
MFKNSYGLKAKIAFICISIAVISSIFSLFLIFTGLNDQEEIIQEELMLISQSINNAIQDQFVERYLDSTGISGRVNNYKLNSTEAISQLNNFVDNYQIYELVLICDLNGNLISSNNKDRYGKSINTDALHRYNYRGESWFNAVMQKKWTEDKSKGLAGVYFEDPNFHPYVEEAFREKKFFNVFATYVYNANNQPIAIAANFVNFSWVEFAMLRIYNELEKTNWKSAQINLIDKSGKLIVDYSPVLNNWSKEIVHDEKVLKKLSLAERGNVAAIAAQKGEEGSLETVNVRRNVKQLAGFAQVAGKKFVNDIGWKILIQIDKSEIFANINHVKILFMTLFALIVSTTIIVSLLFSTRLTKKLLDLTQLLSNSNNVLNRTAQEMASSSEQLSTSANEQAASLQETVSSLNEINSMVTKTSDMANISKSKSEISKGTVNSGKIAIDKMLNAIQNIKVSNDAVLNTVNQGNRKIADIVKVISEIENKTKVINEIVFQTKLLSFNASVEAARAGEHGKGFSVVAQEVGNLAQMSGNSAREISQMLDSSISKVKAISDEIETEIEKIIHECKLRVDEGENVSRECADKFEKILTTTEEINSLINDIASSAKEQAKGLTEINKSMHEIDGITHQNAMAAQETSKASLALIKQGQEIHDISNDLHEIIQGYTIDKANSNNSKYPPNSGGDSYRQNENKTEHHERKQKKHTPIPEDKVPSANDPRFEDL